MRRSLFEDRWRLYLGGLGTTLLITLGANLHQYRVRHGAVPDAPVPAPDSPGTGHCVY